METTSDLQFSAYGWGIAERHTAVQIHSAVRKEVLRVELFRWVMPTEEGELGTKMPKADQLIIHEIDYLQHISVVQSAEGSVALAEWLTG